MKRLMKGSLLLVILASGMSLTRAAQFEIQPFYGYRLGGQLEDLDIEANDSASWGATFGWTINDNNQFEVMWSHQATSFDLHDFQGAQGNFEIDSDIDHYLAGWLLTGSDDKVKPFFSFHAGILDIHPDNFDSDTWFTWSLGGGAKIYVNDTIGFRLGARLDFTYVDSDNAIYCNWYGYCFSGTDADYFNQTEFSAGLIQRFGKM
jgi:hypothetical protein